VSRLECILIESSSHPASGLACTMHSWSKKSMIASLEGKTFFRDTT